MNDIDKARTQHDAKRAVASRRATGSARPEQGIVRHLAVELYNERRRNDKAADATTDRSPDR